MMVLTRIVQIVFLASMVVLVGASVQMLRREWKER